MEGAQRHTGIVAQEHTGRRSTGHDARPPPAEGVDSCTAQAKCTGARRHHPRGRLKVRAAQARKGPPAKAMAWRRPHANRRHCEQPVQQLRATCQAHEPSRPKAVTCRALHRCCKSPAGLCADTLAHPHTCSATPTKTTQKRANASASPRAAHATPTTAAAASGRRPLGQPPAAIHRLQKNPQHQCEAPRLSCLPTRSTGNAADSHSGFKAGAATPCASRPGAATASESRGASQKKRSPQTIQMRVS